jgi:hypothetical protein
VEPETDSGGLKKRPRQIPWKAQDFRQQNGRPRQNIQSLFDEWKCVEQVFLTSPPLSCAGAPRAPVAIGDRSRERVHQEFIR